MKRRQPKEEIHWTDTFPQNPPLDRLMAIDFEMIKKKRDGREDGNVVCEVGIVNGHLEPVYHSFCKPDEIARIENMSEREFRREIKRNFFLNRKKDCPKDFADQVRF